MSPPINDAAFSIDDFSVIVKKFVLVLIGGLGLIDKF